MIEWYQAIILALVQGLTEFLPISSSAHLAISPILLGWSDQGLAFDVAVHVGTLSAVLVYYRSDLKKMARSWFASLVGGKADDDSRLQIKARQQPTGPYGDTGQSKLSNKY